MATSSKAKISIETGRTLVSYDEAVDSGDHIVFTLGTLWSGYSDENTDYSPVVRPDGMVSGRNVLSTHATNDTVTIAGFTAYSKGVEHTVSATSDTITRPATAVAKINSVTMTDAGAIAVIAGTDGASTTFSETRGAAGGPPYIPVDSVEIGQIRVTSDSSAVIAASEIFQVVGTHTERYDYPTWSESNTGKGILAVSAAEKNAHVKFTSALAAIHTADTYKGVWIQYYTPVFTELPKTMDFTPCENSPSVSSTQYYNGTIAAVSRSLGTGSFSAIMTDNISDALLNEQDKVVTVKFWPDRNKSPYILTQGELGITRTYPVADQNKADVVIASENPSVSFLS